MERKKNVGIIVIGDVGRSPRMQYHALSLAREGFNVDMIGYAGSQPISQLQDNDNVSFRFMKTSPELKGGLRKVALPFKVIWQFWTLLWTLTFGKHYDYLLLQNPPAVPAMVVCWLYCLLSSTRFIVDWHNYGYSILALSLGSQHRFVSIYRFIERKFSQNAHAHLCVTKAMKEDLMENWNINASVLYDRPPDMFRQISIKEKLELFEKLSSSYPELAASRFMCTAEGGEVKLKETRPGLVVSSTSWTEDEDFSILLSALEDYEHRCESGEAALPKLVCVITGKGPLKQHYSELISHKRWRHVECVMPWLEPEDYPKVLASADLGICLHTSSSGLDLPMKVVDMFGCCLPVAAFHYPCLAELVKNGENGMVFEDASTLSFQLCQWFDGFPKQNGKSEKFRANLHNFQKQRWHPNWIAKAKPIFCST